MKSKGVTLMFDENEHPPPHTTKALRHIHRVHQDQQRTHVEVDSAAFFSPEPARRAAIRIAAPSARRKTPCPRSDGGRCNPASPPPTTNPKGGRSCWYVQAILSVAALVQLWRTQMLPVLYLVVLAALLVLLWLLVKRCQEYNTAGTVVPGVLRGCCAPRWPWAVCGRSRVLPRWTA